MEILDTIKELSTILKGLPPLSSEQNEHLQRKIRLEFNYNSNHLEGNTLTYSETELLLLFDETIGNHSLRELEEMKASDIAFKMIQSSAQNSDEELTEQFIKELNRILLVKPYWKEAITLNGERTKRKISIGDYKKEPNSVLLDNGEIFNYASPLETPSLMGDLISWFRDEKSKSDFNPVILAADFHYKFVSIHPFDDGNGRLSRLLMNYVLIQNNLPPVIIRSTDKKNYLRTLRAADAGNLELFRNYIAQQLIWSLELYIKAANNESLEEDEDWKKQLSLLKRNLANRDTIKTVKSVDAVNEVITQTLSSTCQKVVDILTEFDDLFLSKTIFVWNPTTGTKRTLTQGLRLLPDIVEKYFFTGLTLVIRFQEFTKDPDNPFSIDLIFEVIFSRHKYEILFNNKVVFKKLYHQIFTDKDITEFANILGKELTVLIEQNINSTQ